ncbi:hypothetical protein DIPPA_24808 [Diplonema papillatum]|nr:hypothetical protein DIPPA_24808 [Diplonema papillatum]
MQHNRHVLWDEENLQRHDETRGTRTVIDHAETPFIYYDSDAEEMCQSTADGPHKVEASELKQRLGLVKTLQEAEENHEKAEPDPMPSRSTLFEMKRQAMMGEQARVLLDILSGKLEFDDDDADSRPGS